MKYNLSKTEVRKSLHTTNRREAIKRAMRLWVEHSNQQFIPIIKETMPGIPTDKFDLMLSMPNALKYFREEFEQKFDTSLKISFIKAYISKIGDDVDVLKQLMDLLTIEEKQDLAGSPAYERKLLILKLNSPNPDKETTKVPSQHSPIQNQPSPDQPQPIKSKTILELVDLYMKEFINDYERNKNRSMPKSSYNESSRSCRVLAAIVGNIQSRNLTTDDIEQYYEVSFLLPSRLNKIYGFTHLTNEQILIHHLDEIRKSSIDHQDRKKNATLKKEFGTVRKFLDWMRLKGYTHGHLNLSSFIKKIDVGSSQMEKPMLSTEDYKLYFNSHKYLKGKHKKPSDFWIPLIGIFTGCRIEEITSLFREDIYQDQESGIWFFNIKEDLTIKKRRKTKASKRIIPVHNQLLNLGLIDYRNQLPKNNHLFPDLKEGKDGRRAVNWDNRFNRHEYEKVNGEVSRPKEPPPQPLSEPGVNLSAQRAPIIQPSVSAPSSSAGTTGVAYWQLGPANI
ncbi:MAG: hypothetical protein GY705_15875, partial [Bacteroidetes bacterium]|nr:hypothetical protein [Bacteroidota bacterium]